MTCYELKGFFVRFVHSIPLNKLKYSFLKSSGPGGQNVNKSKIPERKTRSNFMCSKLEGSSLSGFIGWLVIN